MSIFLKKYIYSIIFSAFCCVQFSFVEAQVLDFQDLIDNPTFQQQYDLSSTQDLYDSTTAVAATKFLTDPAPAEWSAVPSVLVCDGYANNITWKFWDTNAQAFGYKAFYYSFSDPEGIAARSNGSIYVVDSGNNRVVQFSYNANQINYVTSFGAYGSQSGQFSSPKRAALDQYGDLYVVDYGNQRIQKFDPNGNPVNSFQTSGPYLTAFTPTNCLGSYVNSSSEWTFGPPTGVTVSYLDNSIFVVDIDLPPKIWSKNKVTKTLEWAYKGGIYATQRTYS